MTHEAGFMALALTIPPLIFARADEAIE